MPSVNHPSEHNNRTPSASANPGGYPRDADTERSDPPLQLAMLLSRHEVNGAFPFGSGWSINWLGLPSAHATGTVAVCACFVSERADPMVTFFVEYRHRNLLPSGPILLCGRL